MVSSKPLSLPFRHQLNLLMLIACFVLGGVMLVGDPGGEMNALIWIIIISSVAGRLGFARRLPYASTKWAMIGFSESLAKELGPSGIRVNALLPGIVEGPRIEGVFQARAESEVVPYEEVRDRVLNNVSMKRMVSAGDVAEMAVFLCSEAGKNISGQSISVCGNVDNL